MRIDVRWQLLILLLCLVLIGAMAGIELRASGDCTSLVPSPGGRISEGIIGKPQYLNPILAQNNPIDRYFSSLLFRGLTRPLVDGRFVPDMASSWEVTEGGSLILFTLRSDIYWHDGQPFTLDDVIFTLNLIRDDSFPADPRLKEFWSSVELQEIGPATFGIRLPQPYAPVLEAASVGILPAHILRGVDPTRIVRHSFNRQPVGTGPFMVVSGSDWEQSGSLLLAPNLRYWEDGVGIDMLEYRFYGDIEALVSAYMRGEVQAMSNLPPEAIPEIVNLPGVRLFTFGRPRIVQLIFNLDVNRQSVVGDLALRRALVNGVDRQAMVDSVSHGQLLVIDGPYVPTSWAFDPSTFGEYGLAPESVNQVLNSLGWVMGEAQIAREKEGSPLVLTIAHPEEPFHNAIIDNLGEQWGNFGIQLEADAVPYEDLESAMAQGEYDGFLVTLDLSNDPDLYDFWSQEAIVSGRNYGRWNNRQASEALEAGRQLYAVDERVPYYRGFLRYFSEEIPALTLFQFVDTYAISDQVRNVEIGGHWFPIDRYRSLPNWTVLYKEVAVPCVEEVSA